MKRLSTISATHEAYKYIYGQNLMFAKSSVHGESTFREDRAKEQAKAKPPEIQTIIDYSNEFLKILKMEPTLSPKTQLLNGKVENDFYEKLKKDKNLKDIRDIVWMKFTTDGYLGVVAVSADINFDMPISENEYNLKTIKGYWKYNTSGIIIHKLGKEWDESFALVFPLQNIPESLERGDIECGIGNYLIDKGIPILDYYSHRF